MTENAWRYLEMTWEDDPPGAHVAEIVKEVWADATQAANELTAAYIEMFVAQGDEAARKTLVAGRSADSGLDLLIDFVPNHLSIMRAMVSEGLAKIGAPAMEFLQEFFLHSPDLVQKAAIANLLAEFGSAAAGSVPPLVAELATSDETKQRFDLRCAAAFALGKLGVASADVVKALARVAGAGDERQALRSYCMEALMDLGPSAVTAVPVLEQVLKNEAEDDDLRHFAWSALKSVTAKSTEHPCGGTIAEHMRSLYRGVWASDPEEG